jgi:hypothetical protein
MSLTPIAKGEVRKRPRASITKTCGPTITPRESNQLARVPRRIPPVSREEAPCSQSKL